MQIQGSIRRVAVLTLPEGASCAAYVCRQLQEPGVELRVFTQTRLENAPGTAGYIRRLYHRRGLFVALDNLAFECWRPAMRFVPRAYRKLRKLAGVPVTPRAVDVPPVLRDATIPVPCVEVDDINRDGLAALRDYAPDLLILAGAPILKRAVIEVPRVATLNAHCGITPRYAGSSPVYWAMFDACFDDIGYTVHAVTPDVDGGPVIQQTRVPYYPDEPIAGMWPILGQAMYDALISVAKRLIAGETITATPHSGPVVSRPPAGLFVRTVANLHRVDLRSRRFKEQAQSEV
jgi:folate-dependent phosphoribosylglycinamide formyltransferase PurN